MKILTFIVKILSEFHVLRKRNLNKSVKSVAIWLSEKTKKFAIIALES